MRLSMISWIIKTEVCVIWWSRRPRQITQTQGFDKSWYHAKTEFNNCFIIHFSPQKQERSVQPFCFWGEHSKWFSNQADVELDMINAISAADIAFIMSSSQAIVNWLNALDQSDFSQWVWCIIKAFNRPLAEFYCFNRQVVEWVFIFANPAFKKPGIYLIGITKKYL